MDNKLNTKTKRKLEKLKVQAYFCQKGRVLDIGFAANPNPFLQGAYGIDIALPDETPDNYAQTLLCNLNVDKIPFEDEYFENVIAGDVIEHVENPSQLLREINRVLKDNGRLIISTPQANDWFVTLHNWFLRRWVNDPDPGEHLHNWTFLDMTRLLKKNGFLVEKIEGYYMNFPKINFKIRVKKFPMLSWQVFYVAKKVGKPDKSILVNVSNRWRNVEQK